MGKLTIDAFFKRKSIEDKNFGENGQTYIPNSENLVPTHSKKAQRIESEIFDITSLERDPENVLKFGNTQLINKMKFVELILKLDHIKSNLKVIHHLDQRSIFDIFVALDKEGFIRERFFGDVHVRDTTALALKGVHRLQLALVAASREVSQVHQFFSILVFIINIVTASCKRNDELKEAQSVELATKIANDEIESGTGLNQIELQKKKFHIFNVEMQILLAINYYLFEFVFILHLMKEILEITCILCVALQQQSQYILNVMHIVASTKRLLKSFRDSGWDSFLMKITSFCKQHQIDIPDLDAQYVAKGGRSRNQQDKISVMHYYRVDIFITTLDYQLQELNSRFNENSVELLILSTAFDPRDGFKLFKIDDICKLVEKFYPDDFSELEVVRLRIELQHFVLDIPNHPELQSLSCIHELCQGLVKTRKEIMYPLIDRLLRIVLTLPVSTTTTERAFSSMKIIKTKLQNKMEDSFLNDCLIFCIEKEIATNFSIESIIDDFASIKNRRAQITYKNKN
ncbi:uncharacterized protein LOC133824118 [Humulus lupulus]|uniref:uncharacterized protein LOC133824118 n=1 Tax=Humulus lupulus TaxID=3486 RepID=UPI002B414267|nr:uncharacterized protein LOC133824118 [Humulus lupulus]